MSSTFSAGKLRGVSVFVRMQFSDTNNTKYIHLVHVGLVLSVTLTLTLMLQDSGPFSHRTMFRFSKLKLIGLGGLVMVPLRSLYGANQIVIVTILARHSGSYIEGSAAQCLSSLLLKESTDGAKW